MSNNFTISALLGDVRRSSEDDTREEANEKEPSQCGGFSRRVSNEGRRCLNFAFKGFRLSDSVSVPKLLRHGI